MSELSLSKDGMILNKRFLELKGRIRQRYEIDISKSEACQYTNSVLAEEKMPNHSGATATKFFKTLCDKFSQGYEGPL